MGFQVFRIMLHTAFDIIRPNKTCNSCFRRTNGYAFSRKMIMLSPVNGYTCSDNLLAEILVLPPFSKEGANSLL